MLPSLRRAWEESEAVADSVPVPSRKGVGTLRNHLRNGASRTWYLEASNMEPAGTCSSMNTVRESSNDSILVFFGYFFDRSGSFYYGYLFGWGVSRGTGRERGKVHEGGAGRGHVAFLPAVETPSFFETSFSFLWGEFAGFFLGVYVHGIGIPGGSAPSGGGGVECNGSSG